MDKVKTVFYKCRCAAKFIVDEPYYGIVGNYINVLTTFIAYLAATEQIIWSGAAVDIANQVRGLYSFKEIPECISLNAIPKKLGYRQYMLNESFSDVLFDWAGDVMYESA